MAWLRHSSRHVHATVLNHVKDQLDTLGWLSAGTTPFGAPALTLIDKPLVDGDQIRQEARPGSVFVTLGTEPDPEDQELGGPLSMQQIPIFFDVFMDANGLAVAAACDIRDILRGRIGGKRVLDVIDQTTGDPAPGWQLEFTEVERVAPDQRFALHWQAVKTTCEVTFSEEAY
ncbi:hypothetical protein GCM10028801_30730 [Nocardioides maradonensis]